MGIILCLSIILFIIFTLEFTRYDILSASFLTGIVFLIASLAYSIRENSWGVHLHIDTFIFIVFCLYAMLFGEMMFLSLNKRKQNIIKKEQIRYIKIGKKNIYFLFFIGIIVTFLYWKGIKTFASLSGGQSGNMLWDARVYMLEGNSAFGFGMNVIKTFVIMFSIFTIFVFFNNSLYYKTIEKKNKDYYLLLTLIPSSSLIILDTGRTEFIRLFSIAFVLYLFFSSLNIRTKQKNVIKFIKKGLICFIILLLVFWSVGAISNKNGSYTMIGNVTKYVGSGVAGLDVVITQNTKTSGIIFGQNTFRGLYQSLSTIFHNIPVYSNVLPFICFESGEMTNIYTAIYEYYCDFGYIGTVVVYFVMGIFLSWIKKKAEKDQSSFWTLLMAFYYYAIFRQITAADFLTTYLGPTHIIAFVTLFFSYQFLASKKRIKIKF